MTTVTGNDYYPAEPGKSKNQYNVNSNGNGKLENEDRDAFLPPVKIEPGLDSLNRNPEEMELETEENAPPDRYRIVFFIMLIHGVGILMPWNMIINAQAYFENYKLAANTTEVNKLRTNFMFSIGVASQVPNFIMSGVNTFCQCGGSSPRRIMISIMIMTCVFIGTVVLAMVDSSDWSVEFFYITMGMAVILNMATGVYQNSTFGLAAILPMKYTNAIVLGNNLSGVFIAVINLVCLALSPNPRTQAIYYFVTAIVILLVAFDAYFLLPVTNYYKYFKRMVARKQKHHQAVNRTCTETLSMFLMVFKKIWVQAVSVWFVFFVTLAVFPGIWANVKRIDFPIHDDYWAPIFCFLSFNLFAFLGNLASSFVKVPGERWVWIPVAIRGLLIPFFLMCNFKPENRTFDVIISNDYIFIVGGVILGFTSGYFSSLCMMYGPKLVDQQHAGTAGMLMAFFLVLGIGTGVNFSLVLGILFTNQA